MSKLNTHVKAFKIFKQVLQDYDNYFAILNYYSG